MEPRYYKGTRIIYDGLDGHPKDTGGALYMNMVEKVARAISVASGAPVDLWEQEPFGAASRARYRAIARVAIAALGEPTPKMVAATIPAFEQVDAAIQHSWVHGFELSRHPDGSPLQRAWRAMIDAALSEGEN